MSGIRELISMLNRNELRVLRTVYETGLISRVRVAQRLHLTRATVTNHIKRLTDLGLIKEVGKGVSSSRRGRKEVLLMVNPEAGFIISIHIALHYTTYGLVNLNGRIIEKKTLEYTDATRPEAILSLLTGKIRDLVENTDIDISKVFGMAVAVPGIIDTNEGLIRERSLDGWQYFPLRAFLEEKLDFHVLVENDVKTLTFGEYQFGTGDHVKDMICLWLEDGIGAGIFNDGRLIRGVTSSAGEIGFNEFILELPVKKSILIDGQPKFWGDILSYTNISATIQRGLAQGWKSSLTDKATISDFATAVEAADPLGLYIFKLLARIIGVVCCNLVYAFNPKVLVLSGPLFRQMPQLSDDVRNHLNNGVLRTPIEAVELKTSILGEDGVTIGGAALALDHLFRTHKRSSGKSSLPKRPPGSSP